MRTRLSFLVWLLLGGSLLWGAAETASAQPLPVAPSLEAGIGVSSLQWDDELTRVSYLPGLTLVLATPTTFWTSVELEPLVGLHFDGVRLTSINEYSDHYTVLSARVGLLALTIDNRKIGSGHLLAGFGIEARRPIYVRAHIYSRDGPNSRRWVPAPEPPAFDEWGFYWTIRLGHRYERQALFIDVMFDSKKGFLLSAPFPENALDYLSMHLGYRITL